MSDDQSTQRNRPEKGDKFIPPPMDPYATYQTPYERRASPEPNPFIEFRRFADKQISDMFSSFPVLGNFANMFGMEEGMKTFREQLEKDMKDMLAHQKKMEDLIESSKSKSGEIDMPSASSVNPNTTSPSSSMSMVKHADLDTGISRRLITAVTSDGKRYKIDPITGQATEEQSPQPEAQTQEDSNSAEARWKRGFQNCPELKKYQGETELDVYESLEDHETSSAPLKSMTRPTSSWSSWLPTYGFDGKQRSKQDGPTTTRQENSSMARPCDITTYYDRQSKWMDPFERDRDFLPWLFLSQYSPLFLTKPELRPLRSVQLHNGCESKECHEPMRVIDHDLQGDRNVSDKEIQLRSSLSEHLPWADAFEDLISLEKTGKMPDREIEGRVHPHEMTHRWVRDMVERGLLGSDWWLEDDSVMRNSWSSHHQIHCPGMSRLRRFSHDDGSDHNEDNSTNIANMSEDFVDAVAKEYLKYVTPIMDALREDTDAVHHPFNTNVSQATPSTNSQKHFPEQHTESKLPTTNDETLTTSKQPQPQPKVTPKPSIISTLTTMTSRTLPDGSVETKRVLKKRFADGKEESEESTELIHPQLPAPISKGELNSTKQHQQNGNKPGWFWT